MIQFLNLVSGIAWLLYLVCGLAVLLAIRSWWLAQLSRHHTIYSLEKEVAGERGTRALIVGFVAAGLGALVFMADANGVVSTPVVLNRSPTPNIALLFNTPTLTSTARPATLPPPSPTPLRGGNPPPPQPTINQPAPPQRSPTPRPTASETAMPPTLVPLPPQCPDLNARIIAPGTDAHLSGSIPIVGTANIANFQYYKIEFGAGDQPPVWKVLGDLHRRPVSENVLDLLNTAGFTPGVYRLRLTVVDSTGNYPIAPCSVRVFIGD